MFIRFIANPGLLALIAAFAVKHGSSRMRSEYSAVKAPNSCWERQRKLPIYCAAISRAGPK